MGSHPRSRVPHLSSLRPMGRRRTFKVKLTTARRKRGQHRVLRSRANPRAPWMTTSLAVKRSQKTRAKASPRAPKTEILAAEGKAAQLIPPAPRTTVSPAESGRRTGQSRPSADHCAWRWAARVRRHCPFPNNDTPLGARRAPLRAGRTSKAKKATRCLSVILSPIFPHLPTQVTVRVMSQ